MERPSHDEPRAESHFTLVRRVAQWLEVVGVMVEQLWLRGIDRWSCNSGKRAQLRSSWARRERESE